MTTLKKQLENVKALEVPTSKDLQSGFDALLTRIKSARQDYKGIRGLVGEALKLALKDYILHNNKNSLQKLITLPVDYKVNSKPIYLYNLYNVKDYLSSLGFKLELSIKEGFTIYFKEGYKKPSTLEELQTYEDFLVDFKEAKKQEQESKPKLSNYELAKEAVKNLSGDELATFKGYIASLTK